MVRNRLLSAILVVLLVGGTATVTVEAAVDTTTAPAAATAAATSDSVTVTVKNVTDGDTINVWYDNGSVDTVRLLGVDTPEVHVENQPREYEGVPNTEAGKNCLRDAGRNASQYLKSRLDGKTVTLKFDSQADRRGYYGRLLAYVFLDGEDYNLNLLQRGHARVYDSRFTKRAAYYDAENASQDALRGLWHCRTVDDGGDGGGGDDASGQPSIEWVYAEASSPNDERVQITNTGDGELDLSGYTLRDAAGHTYTFPDGFTLASGESVWVHSGSGTDDAHDLYAGFDHEIWNDDGDTATLLDADGDQVASRSY